MPRVVAAYGAVSLLVIEAADLIFPRLPLPDWTVTLVVWLGILGFPVAVALAWALEWTPEGVRRTAPASEAEISSIVHGSRTRLWLTGLALGGGLLFLALGFWAGTRSGGGGAVEGGPAGDPPGRSGAAYVDPSEDERPAIAVLPFADVSQAGDQGYFSDGMSEEILNVLSRIRDLRVAARSSAFSYRSADVDARQAGDELGVPYVLAGSVRKFDDQVRISVELVGVEDGFRLWAETYQRTLDDVFAIQTEIARVVARELRVPLGLEPEELADATLDTLAYDRYLAGRAALRRRGSGVTEAIRLFEAAAARDSTWAPAWAALAEAYSIVPLYPGPEGESMDSAFWARNLEAAERAARRALELDPGNASARVALGSLHRDRREWDAAERELLRALEIDPDNGEAHVQYAEVLWGVGRLDESLREGRRALALDRTPVRLDVVGFVLYQCGRPEEAVPLLEEGIAADPEGEVHFLRTVLGRLLLFTGHEDEAAARFAPYFPDPEAIRMQAEALGRQDPALLPEDETRVMPQTWALLGDTARALSALEREVLSIPFRVPYQIWDPAVEPVWATARFREGLLPRLNLAGASARCADGAGSR
ncbi:MAG TPA: tetratricopeptide repeat protein [Longimicrobiales bacterium]|nr:tetratricopeptide repeat protein [Longimicrobiales bacterium]